MPYGLLGLRENPFVESHDARLVYPGRAHQDAVARLRRGIENREPFMLVTGPSGSGKTIALQVALAEAEPHTLVLIPVTPSLTPSEFRERLLSGLSPQPSDPASAARPADGIEGWLRVVHDRGHVAILVVEEAQNLGLPLLEELRVLSNLEADGRKLLQIVLAGQPRLEEILSRRDCEALRQRVAVRCRLGPLSAEETEGYIRHRIVVAGGESGSLFSSESCQVVHLLAHGIPREISLVAGEALVQAHAAGASTVGPGHVTAAAEMLGFRSVLEDPSPAGQAMPAPVAQTGEVAPLVATPAADPLPSAPPAMTSGAGPVPASRENSNVEAWVARFRDPSGPPRIGSRVAAAASEAFDARPVDAAREGHAAHAVPHGAGPPRRALPRRRSSHGGRTWPAATWAAGALVVVAAGGLVLAITFRSLARGRPSSPALASVGAREASRTRTLGAPSARPALERVPHSGTSRPRSTAPTPAASSASAAPARARSVPALAASTRRFGLEVATFIVESRAVEERDRLAAGIPLPCRIATSSEGGVQTYRVLLGPVASRREAVRLGADLSGRGLVDQARVVRWATPDTTRR